MYTVHQDYKILLKTHPDRPKVSKQKRKKLRDGHYYAHPDLSTRRNKNGRKHLPNTTTPKYPNDFPNHQVPRLDLLSITHLMSPCYKSFSSRLLEAPQPQPSAVCPNCPSPVPTITSWTRLQVGRLMSANLNSEIHSRLSALDRLQATALGRPICQPLALEGWSTSCQDTSTWQAIPVVWYSNKCYATEQAISLADTSSERR
ncbi:hypothetical protein JVT61DRAFT_11276 [Boletus reticuloceps]|uniref:Uncharacterized protein n=1 Tax=Boletus reticuloceps TaxID=495285 RepID=A0A8I3A4S1_9AGAM|nr:hypothetical protein JVT61DRAFT_11276 [Boletus reticuloceps]